LKVIVRHPGMSLSSLQNLPFFQPSTVETSPTPDSHSSNIQLPNQQPMLGLIDRMDLISVVEMEQPLLLSTIMTDYHKDARR
jgi:hypothetical protein